jgi:hypothetical protein
MTAEELGKLKDILVKAGSVPATASDGDVAAAHAALLTGPNATEYRASLQANGIQTGPSWLTILGVVGGAIAVYFIWKNYQTEEVGSYERPEPSEVRYQMRGVRDALGALGGRHRMAGCSPRRLGAPPSARAGSTSSKYEFEPEIRLEGYRRKARRT